MKLLANIRGAMRESERKIQNTSTWVHKHNNNIQLKTQKNKSTAKQQYNNEKGSTITQMQLTSKPNTTQWPFLTRQDIHFYSFSCLFVFSHFMIALEQPQINKYNTIHKPRKQTNQQTKEFDERAN
jgi:hypothetical protein